MFSITLIALWKIAQKKNTSYQLTISHEIGQTVKTSGWINVIHYILYLANNPLIDHHLCDHSYSIPYPPPPPPPMCRWVCLCIPVTKSPILDSRFQTVLEISMGQDKSIRLEIRNIEFKKESLTWVNINSNWDQLAWDLKEVCQVTWWDWYKKKENRRSSRLAFSQHFIGAFSDISLSLLPIPTPIASTPLAWKQLYPSLSNDNLWHWVTKHGGNPTEVDVDEVIFAQTMPVKLILSAQYSSVILSVLSFNSFSDSYHLGNCFGRVNLPL